MVILLLVGMPGAGKEEFVKVAKGKGYHIIRMGDVVRDFVSANGYPMKNEIVGKIAGEERNKHGVEIWAKRTVKKILDMNIKKIVVDGIRCPEEVQIYKEKLKDKVLVIGIFATQSDRYKRIMLRHRPDDVSTWEEFLSRENRELSWGLGSAFARSDYMLTNTESLHKYQEKVQMLLTMLEKKYEI